MKLLFDENLSPRLPERLSRVYSASAHVQDVGLSSASDGTLWEYAKAHGYVIVTKDADFAERSVLESEVPKVLWIRTGNCRTEEIENLLRANAQAVKELTESREETCLVLGGV